MQEMYVSKPMYNREYWDCNCTENYIHKKPRNYCPLCGGIQAESTDSRIAEVILLYNPQKDSALYFASVKNGRS
jgi:hypothetical protein